METDPRQTDGADQPGADHNSPAEKTGDAPATPFAWIGIALVTVYRTLVSPLLPASCRYRPTCSQYTLTALRRYGLVRGTWLGLKRILRCHPLNSGGHDPVP